MTREQSKQALHMVGGEVYGGDICRAAIYRLFGRIEGLEGKKRQLILAETATIMCIDSLKPIEPLYCGFEDALWLHFSTLTDLETRVDAFLDPTEKAIYAKERYYDYIRGMFSVSGQTRHQFYYGMLTEAGIAIEFDSIAFGARAAAFQREAAMSVHMEHLLVFYSVELFLKAHMELHPKDSPITDDRLEPFYRHFEEAIPLFGKFDAYTKSDELFKFSACRRRLPSIN